MRERKQCSWNEDIEVEFGGPLGPRVLYPKEPHFDAEELDEALEELAAGWDGEWELQVETDSGRYSAPLIWVGGEEFDQG